MLFTNILLCVWFVAWLIHAFWLKDFGDVATSWMEAVLDDEYEDSLPKNCDKLLEKSGENDIYHLNCNECGYDWWSIEANVNYCPHCGVKQELKK